MNLTNESKVYEDEKSKFDNLNLEFTKNNEILKSFNSDIERINRDIAQTNEKKSFLERENRKEEDETKGIEEKILIEVNEKENLKTQLSDNNKNLDNKKS